MLPIVENKSEIMTANNSFHRKNLSLNEKFYKFNHNSRFSDLAYLKNTKHKNLSLNANNMTSSTHIKSNNQSIFSQKSIATQSQHAATKIKNSNLRYSNRSKLEELLKVMVKYSKSNVLARSPQKLIGLSKQKLAKVEANREVMNDSKINSKAIKKSLITESRELRDSYSLILNSVEAEGAKDDYESAKNIFENSSEFPQSKVSSSKYLHFKPSFKKKKDNYEDYNSTVIFLRSLEDHHELIKPASRTSFINSSTKIKPHFAQSFKLNSGLHDLNKSLINKRSDSNQKQIHFRANVYSLGKVIAIMRSLNKFLTKLHKVSNKTEQVFDKSILYIEKAPSKLLNSGPMKLIMKSSISQKEKYETRSPIGKLPSIKDSNTIFNDSGKSVIRKDSYFRESSNNEESSSNSSIKNSRKKEEILPNKKSSEKLFKNRLLSDIDVEPTISNIKPPQFKESENKLKLQHQSFRRVKNFFQSKAIPGYENDSDADSEEDFIEGDDYSDSSCSIKNRVDLSSNKCFDPKEDFIDEYIRERVHAICNSIVSNYVCQNENLIDNNLCIQKSFRLPFDKDKAIIIKSMSLKLIKPNIDHMFQQDPIDYNHKEEVLNNSYSFKYFDTSQTKYTEEPRYRKVHQIYSRKQEHQSLYGTSDQPYRQSRFYSKQISLFIKPETMGFKEYQRYLIARKDNHFTNLVNNEHKASLKRIRFQRVVNVFRRMHSSELKNRITRESNTIDYRLPLKYFNNKISITKEINQHLLKEYYSNIYDLIVASISRTKFSKENIDDETELQYTGSIYSSDNPEKVDFLKLITMNRILQSKIFEKAKDSLANSHSILQERMLKESDYLFKKICSEERRITRQMTVCPNHKNVIDAITETNSTNSSDSKSDVSIYEEQARKKTNEYNFIHNFNIKQDSEGLPLQIPIKVENAWKRDLVSSYHSSYIDKLTMKNFFLKKNKKVKRGFFSNSNKSILKSKFFQQILEDPSKSHAKNDFKWAGAMTKAASLLKTFAIKTSAMKALHGSKDEAFFYIKDNNFYKFKEIIEKKQIDLEATDSEGNTMLNVAVLSNNFEFTSYLLELGANVNTINIKFNTPLHNALMNHNFLISDLLISFNANQNLRNLAGKNPWECQVSYLS